MPWPHTVTTVVDNDGHGTSVAGIIGAAKNNNFGIAGVVQNVELVSLKVVGSTDELFASRLIKAVSHRK